MGAFFHGKLSMKGERAVNCVQVRVQNLGLESVIVFRRFGCIEVCVASRGTVPIEELTKLFRQGSVYGQLEIKTREI